MADRPAAELLDTYGPGSDFAKTWGEGMQGFIVSLIERLARAERALADIEALHTLGNGYATACPGCGNSYPCRTIRALRASQEDETGAEKYLRSRLDDPEYRAGYIEACAALRASQGEESLPRSVE